MAKWNLPSDKLNAAPVSGPKPKPNDQKPKPPSPSLPQTATSA
jgi:hypothetical protein